MKKFLTLIAAFITALVLSGQAKASPMYYTFEGTVSSINTDAAGIIAGAGLSVGSNVTYKLIVDFAADGTATSNDGTLTTYTDTATIDYFFDDYVSGDALHQKDGGYNNVPWAAAEINSGYNNLNTASGSYLNVNSADDPLKMFSFSSRVSDWAVGTVVYGANWAYDSTGAYSQLQTNLTLTSIAPVPEPSTMLLLGGGLMGLIAFRKRFRS